MLPPEASELCHLPIYTFHPCRSDGTSDTFVAVELDGEHGIRAVAATLIEQHPSCAWIEVWQDDRPVEHIHARELA